VRDDQDRRDFDLARGELQAASAALGELERMARLHFTAPDIVQTLREEYEARIDLAQGRVRASRPERRSLQQQEMRQARRLLLLAEKQQMIESLHQGQLAPAICEHLLRDIDSRLIGLEEDREPGVSG